VSKATVRIIDHKKVLMTPDEFRFYNDICKGYDRPNFQGKDLFQDHFETNEDGIIVFVKPPHKKYSSLEVFTFLISLQVNQQLRLAQDQIHSLVSEAEEKFKDKFKEFDSLQEKVKLLKEEVEYLKGNSVKGNSKRSENNDGTK